MLSFLSPRNGYLLVPLLFNANFEQNHVSTVCGHVLRAVLHGSASVPGNSSRGGFPVLLVFREQTPPPRRVLLQFFSAVLRLTSSFKLVR